MRNVPQPQSTFQTHTSFRRVSRPKVGAHGPTQRAIHQSQPWQYALPGDGRKWRVLQAERRRLAVYLAGYPACYPGLKRIARDLRWSLATVKRRLRELDRHGVMATCGRMGRRGTTIRTLIPAALLLVHPRTAVKSAASGESEPSSARESEPQEVRRKLLEQTKARQIDGRATRKTASARPARTSNPLRPESTAKSEPKPFERVALEILDYFTYRYCCSEMASSLFHWLYIRFTKRKVAPPVRHLKAYYFKAAENFFEQHDGHADGILANWDIEQATAGMGGSRIRFCAEHQKWESPLFPCEHCHRQKAA